MSLLGIEFTLPLLTLGVITGMTYGILGTGLVFIFRASRIVNFAHGQIGAFGAAMLSLGTTRWHLPYWVALVGAALLSGAIGATTEVAAVRRLRQAPKVMSVVVTLGIAQFLALLAFVINAASRAGSIFPQPPGLPSFEVGALLVTPAYAGMLFGSPVLVAVMWWTLRRTRLGLAIRGAADDPDAARLAGVPAGRPSTAAWVVAGMLSCFTAAMILPTQGFTAGDTFGPTLLLRALAPAVLARMASLPVTLVAGVAVGIVEQVILWNHPRGGTADLALFAVILVGLLAQRRPTWREDPPGTWLTVRPWPPVPDVWLRSWAVRNRGVIGTALAALLLVPVAAVVSNASAVILTAIVAFALVGLSLGVVTGLGGQVSFGQFAVAAVGAVVSYRIVAATGNFPLALAGASAGAALVATAIGLPALRLPGLMLAVTTLSFALVSSTWLLRQSWMLGDGVDPGRPVFGTVSLDSGRAYHAYSIVILALGLWLASNVWRGAFGRTLRAVRDNEHTARSFGVRATRVKLQAFAFSGALAGLGGSVFGHSLTTLRPGAFTTSASISVVAMAALGGIGWLVGPIIGAVYIIGLPRFVPLDSAGLAATAFGWLILVLYVPGGLAQLMRPARQAILTRLAGRTRGTPAREASPAARVRLVDIAERRQVHADDVVLRVVDISKRFGGVTAVEGFSLDVRAREIVGMIGPNGAGKTTAFDCISGFVRPDEGAVSFDGRDVTRSTPDMRSRLGLVRSFQEAALFPTMTPVEAVAVASQRERGSGLVISAIGLHRPDRRARTHAEAIVDAMGLGDHRTKLISELSTGTRRIAELACMVALEPAVLLLDEPSAGIAQRETEALTLVLRALRDDLGMTLVIIEHDLPMVFGLAERVIAMASGHIIAHGPPHAIRTDPGVVRAYIGGDEDSIRRSGER